MTTYPSSYRNSFDFPWNLLDGSPLGSTLKFSLNFVLCNFGVNPRDVQNPLLPSLSQELSHFAKICLASFENSHMPHLGRNPTLLCKSTSCRAQFLIGGRFFPALLDPHCLPKSLRTGLIILSLHSSPMHSVLYLRVKPQHLIGQFQWNCTPAWNQEQLEEEQLDNKIWDLMGQIQTLVLLYLPALDA